MKNFDYINCHTHTFIQDPKTYSLYVQPLQNFNPSFSPYCLGLHPWDLDKITLIDWITKFEKNFNDPNCVAIGEVGIDFYKNPNHDYQDYLQYFFDKATDLKKPLVLHIVHAYDELLNFLKNKKITTPIIIHAFNGPESFMEYFSQQPIYYSLGPRELNRKKTIVYKKFILEKLLLETDDSNTSIEDCYQLATHYFELEIEYLKLNVYRNFTQIFPTL